MEEELIKMNGWDNARRKVRCERQHSRQKGKQEATEGYNIFLAGLMPWLEGYCTIPLFSSECYPRPSTSAFSAEVSKKSVLLRTTLTF